MATDDKIWPQQKRTNCKFSNWKLIVLNWMKPLSHSGGATLDGLEKVFDVWWCVKWNWLNAHLHVFFRFSLVTRTRYQRVCVCAHGCVLVLCINSQYTYLLSTETPHNDVCNVTFESNGAVVGFNYIMFNVSFFLSFCHFFRSFFLSSFLSPA